MKDRQGFLGVLESNWRKGGVITQTTVQVWRAQTKAACWQV